MGKMTYAAFVLAVAILAAAAYAAQGGSGSIPVSCFISPKTISVPVAETAPLSLACADAGGALVPCPPLHWSATIGSVDTPSPPGGATFSAGTTAGRGTISAQSSPSTDPQISCTIPAEVSPGIPSVVKIKPSAASVYSGSSQQFSAQIFDSYGNPIISAAAAQFRWNTIGGIGTVDSNGLFLATAEGAGQVTATYDNTPSLHGITGTADVQTLAQQSSKKYCEISPAPANVMVTQQQQLTATCYDSDPRMMNPRGAKQVPCPAIIWSATGGEIAPIKNPSAADTQSAAFTAGKSSGAFTVTANEDSPRACASCTMSCTSQLNVLPGNPYSVSISPTSATLYTGDTEAFSAFAYDQYGNIVPDAQFAWSASGGAGSIKEGLFAAATAGTGIVRVETTGPSLTQPFATAQVSVSDAPSGGSGGGSGGSGGTGGGAFYSSSVVSYTCAGQMASLNIRIYKPGAYALVNLYYLETQPPASILSVNATNNQNISFTPNSTGKYELRVSVGVEQRTAGFTVPGCTPATLNITKNVSIELQQPPAPKIVPIGSPPGGNGGNVVPIGGLPATQQEGTSWYIWAIAAVAIIIVIGVGYYLVAGSKKE